jgi:hypothetical protein
VNIRDLAVSESEMGGTRKRSALVLGLGPRERQPFLALHFLPTKNHPRTGSVPLDGGNFDIVLARDHSRALRVARDGVKGLAGCIDNYRVDNVGFTTDHLELDGWTLVDGCGWVDKSCATCAWEGGRG